MSKPTPGPWTVDETKAFGAYGVWTDYVTHPGHDGAGYGSQICSVVTLHFGLISDNERSDERTANAYLIAAAPDLLAACQESRDACAALFRFVALSGEGVAAMEYLLSQGVKVGFGVHVDAAIAKAVPEPKPLTETLDCGCTVTCGNRCPVHGQP